MNGTRKLCLAVLVSAVALFACKKPVSDIPVTPPTPPGPDPVVVTDPAVDPAVANTIGFFLDDWAPRTFATPAYVDAAISGSGANTVTVDASAIITKVPQTIFGANAVWWMGPANTDATAVSHISNLHPNVVRFPGGSSSDVYFWNGQQGVNPPDAPAMIPDKDGVMKQPGYNYGKTNFNWMLTLDGFYSLMQQTGNQGIITVNYGYARYGTGPNPVATAAHLAADWVRYDNGRTKYWEVGNENFGDWEWGYRIDPSKNKDGQPEYLTGALYARHFKVFVDSMQKAATETGKKIYIGAVTYDSPAEAWQTNTVKTWNSGMMANVNGSADYYVVHNYITPYGQNSKADVIFAAAATVPGQMMSYVTQTLQANGAAIKPVVMDEWNMWAQNQKQQVSNASGVFAVLVLGESLKSKYGLAARWDLLNGWSNGDDHGMFSSGDEPGVAKWSQRPSFYYLHYFQKCLGDRLVGSTVVGSTNIKAYGSTFTSGQAGVTLVNTSAAAVDVEVKMKNFLTGSRFYWYSLEGGTDNGEFSRKVVINGSAPAGEAGGPADYATLKARSAVTVGGIKVTVPARGTVFVIIDKK